MKFRSTSFLFAFLVILGSSYAQQESDYTQDLPGVDVSLDMIAIPSGTFHMGSEEGEAGRNKDEGPVREIEVEGFWMSKVEITWELYNLFIERTIDNLKNETKGSEVQLDADAVSGATTPYVDMSLGMGRDSNYPAVNITQRAASTFCEWLSSITGHYYRLRQKQNGNMRHAQEQNNPIILVTTRRTWKTMRGLKITVKEHTIKSEPKSQIHGVCMIFTMLSVRRNNP